MHFGRRSKYPQMLLESNPHRGGGSRTHSQRVRTIQPGKASRSWDTEADGEEGTHPRVFCGSVWSLVPFPLSSPRGCYSPPGLGVLQADAAAAPIPCPPGPGGDIAWPPMAAHTTGLLTWVSRISSLCPPCRIWVRCAGTRGCLSLYQVTAGSGSESASQLRTALSPAFTRSLSWGILGACLKVGGTGAGDKQSKGLSVALPMSSQPQPQEAAYRPTRVTWQTPPWGMAQTQGVRGIDLLGDLGKASCPLWASASWMGQCSGPPGLFPMKGRPWLCSNPLWGSPEPPVPPVSQC